MGMYTRKCNGIWQRLHARDITLLAQLNMLGAYNIIPLVTIPVILNMLRT